MAKDSAAAPGIVLVGTDVGNLDEIAQHQAASAGGAVAVVSLELRGDDAR